MNYYFLLFFACLFMASCDKEDEPQPPTKTQLLTASAWVYDNGGLDTDKNGTVDVAFSLILQPCVLDNKGTFNADGSGINDEGLTKCVSTAPQTTSFAWNFANNEANVNITGNGLFGIGGQFKVLELTSAKLGLSKDTTVAPFGNIAMIANLKH